MTLNNNNRFIMASALTLLCTSIIIFGSVTGQDGISANDIYEDPIFTIDKRYFKINRFGTKKTIDSRNELLKKATKVGGGAIEIIKFGLEILEALKSVIDDRATEDNFKEIFDKLDRNFNAISNVQETIDQMMEYSMDAFDMLQKRLNQRTEEIMADIDSVGKKVDRNYGYLLEIFKIVSKSYTIVEKARFEMHEEFECAMDYAKGSRIEPILTRLNNFVSYFSNEKARISQLVRNERIAILSERNGFLQYLKDSRTPKGDSLQSFLNEVMKERYAIPQYANDTIAYAALSSMYYGVKTEISIMRYLVRANIYLADDAYRNRDIDGFNRHMEEIVTDFRSFQDTLIGSGGLIDGAVNILKTVANLGYPGCSEESSPENLLKRANHLKQEKLNITDAALPLIMDAPGKLMAELRFHKSSPKTPIGPWIDGARVSYAVQYRNPKNMYYSKVGEWSEPFRVTGSANPILRVPAHSTYTRLIFRRFDNDTPQFVGVLEHGSQIDFWDINRDVYNAASSSDQTKAMNEAKQLIAIGANTSAQFDLGSSSIHAAAEIGNVKFAETLLLGNKATISETDTNGYTALHTAAEKGWDNFVDMLIQNGSNVTSRTHSGCTPLHLAVTNGNSATVQTLLNAKYVDVNAQDDQRVTPLHKAVQQGFESILQNLLDDSQINVNLQSNGSLTSLHLSVLLRNPEITRKLLQAREARLNLRSNGDLTALHFATLNGNLPALKLLVDLDGTDVNAMSANDWTPLHYAVSLKRANVVSELLKINNTMINALGVGRITPLHLAAATDQTDVVTQLLERGAEMELPTREGLTALQLAVVNFNKDIVTTLLSKGADLGARTANGSTILHLAAASGNTQAVKYILKLGNISLTVRDNKMETPLDSAEHLGHSDVVTILIQNIAAMNTQFMKAAENGQLENVTSLFERGAEVNTNTTDGETPLHKAAYNGHLLVAKYLVNNGAEVDRRDGFGETPLHKAVRNNSLGLMNYLIEVGADVNEQSANGSTPLHLAIALGKSRIVEALLKLRNVNVNLPSSDLLTPLHLAAINGTSKYVEDLIEKGAAIDAPNKEGVTALQLAAVNNHEEVMGILLKKGANVNARTTNGSTIVHLAIAGHNLPIIQRILETGNAKMNVRDDHMNTPLLLAMRSNDRDAVALLEHYIGDISVASTLGAVKFGHLDEVKSLLLRGAEVDGADGDGRTPLLWAAAKGHLDIVKFLADNGAMTDTKDNGGLTPLWWAAYWGRSDIVEFLLKNGAFCDVEDSDMRTALFWGSLKGYFEVVKSLVESGASVNIRNSWGETALFWARKNHHQDVARYLLSHGATE